MEQSEPALALGGEAVVPQAGDEHGGPLHPLGLVNGRDHDGVR